MRKGISILLAGAAAIASSSLLAAASAFTTPASTRKQPAGPKRDQKVQREIAEHNAAIEAKKAAKRANKLAGKRRP